ncbi:phenylacetate-CoA ligase [Pedobacter terrae]|uniref:Phenylacetate-CoA ligase n=1 Tax=Pedobacter terrae TaxID=405671 RepID=A0A1G8AJN6_9SPHI|nr:AMP-binding protein [Pedobacter terrae]SDH21107.1 phenylacetate-CoA ligase [Pedobacter terrae]
MINPLLNQYYQVVKQSDLFRSYYLDHEDYLNAPIVGKKELIKLLNGHFDLHSQERGVYLVRSGGSTQKPLIFPVDITENLEQRAVLASALLQAKVFTPKTIALNMFGYMDMYRTAAIMDDLLERCKATTLVASAGLPYENAYQMALNFKPDLLLGTPSVLFLFAQYLKKNQLRLSINNLLFGGEFLPPSHVKLFEDIFGTRQIYSLYGSAETGIWAWCNYSRSPSLFSVIDGLVVELSSCDAGGYGSLLVSNLFRKRFPIFRYNTGDIGKWVEIDGQPYLELKGRSSNSFMFNECNYELDDFNAVFSDVERFQIQIASQDGSNIIRFLLITDVANSNQEAYIGLKLQQLYEIFGYPVKNLEVLVGKDLTLYINATTGKTPIIVDHRV